MENLEKKLKELKNIQPDFEYTSKSRMLILHSKQAANPASRIKFFEIFRIFATASVGLFLLITIIGGSIYINKNYSPITLDGLNQQSLILEAKEINTSIESTLEQIKFLDQANQKTIETVKQISKENLSVSVTNETSELSEAHEEKASSTMEIENFLIESPSSTIYYENKEKEEKISEILEKLSR